MGLLSYSGDFAHAYLLRRALYLADELDALLDESWLREGLERLSTTEALSATLGPLSRASPHAQIAALESTWYMRNQLLRDTDWSSMAHGLEVRVPFVDACLLEHLGPAIASAAPPTKQDLAACATKLHPEILARLKTGFRTPVREWSAQLGWAAGRGLRGWADVVHQAFRTSPDISPAQVLSVAAE
jgi:asparagine synthase (glutamine-hydrolysing)